MWSVGGFLQVMDGLWKTSSSWQLLEGQTLCSFSSLWGKISEPTPGGQFNHCLVQYIRVSLNEAKGLKRKKHTGVCSGAPWSSPVPSVDMARICAFSKSPCLLHHRSHPFPLQLKKAKTAKKCTLIEYIYNTLKSSINKYSSTDNVYYLGTQDERNLLGNWLFSLIK